MSAAAVDTLFDAAFLAQLETLALAARQLARGRQRAERRSQVHGASIEFAEYRQFVNGDDWRHIDWNAYARWRQLVLKLFVEEEDLHVYLLFDCSLSMDWGQPRKFDHVRRIVAGLAYLTLANLDRAAAVPFGLPEGAYPAWASSRGRHRFLQLLRYLANCPLAAGPPPALADSARRWCATRPRRGLAVWVSDLWGATPADAMQALDRLRHARHELAVIQIIEPDENAAGEIGEFELEEVESGGRRTVIVDGRLAREYRARFEAYQETVRRYCRQHQIPLLQTDTRVSVPDLLLRCLREGGFVR
jgi:uncharacterized protein (DUF58 family)